MTKFLILISMLTGAMFQKDVRTVENGKELGFYFMGHGSVVVEYEGKYIYVDPVGMFSDYSEMPKADVILITHHHDDHLDPATVKLLSGDNTVLLSTKTVIGELGRGEIINNGEKRKIGDYLEVEAVPAYNTTEGRDIFHPGKGRDNGYLLTIGGKRVYISGDTEPTPEMLALKDIDIAFLPVNQPYTMTVEQAVEAVKQINPKIFYPYHYGQTEHVTDIERLEKELDGSGIEVRIKDMK